KDLLAADYVLLVRKSDQDNAPALACGAIGGVPEARTGALSFALAEENGSGYLGVAVLTPNRADTLPPQLYLVSGLTGQNRATPTTTKTPNPAVTATRTPKPTRTPRATATKTPKPKATKTPTSKKKKFTSKTFGYSISYDTSL